MDPRPAPSADLSEKRRRLLEALMREQHPEAADARRIPRRAGSGPAPLSFAQERLWFLHQYYPQSPIYNMPAQLPLQGPVSAAVVGRVLDEIVRRHESLRTTFALHDQAPVQVIAPALHVDLRLHDLSALPDAQREAEFARIAHEEGTQLFDLARGPLLRAALGGRAAAVARVAVRVGLRRRLGGLLAGALQQGLELGLGDAAGLRELGGGQRVLAPLLQQRAAVGALLQFEFALGVLAGTPARQLVQRGLAVLGAELVGLVAVEVEAVRRLGQRHQVAVAPGIAAQERGQLRPRELAGRALLDVRLDAQLEGLGRVREEGGEQGLELRAGVLQGRALVGAGGLGRRLALGGCGRGFGGFGGQGSLSGLGCPGRPRGLGCLGGDGRAVGRHGLDRGGGRVDRRLGRDGLAFFGLGRRGEGVGRGFHGRRVGGGGRGFLRGCGGRGLGRARDDGRHLGGGVAGGRR